MSKKTRNIIIAVAVLLVLVVGALLAWNHFKPAAQVGAKTIVLEVVHGDASTKSFSIQTDAENLRGAGFNVSAMNVYQRTTGLYTTNGEWMEYTAYVQTGKDQKDAEISLGKGGYSAESKGVAYVDEVKISKVDALPDGVGAISILRNDSSSSTKKDQGANIWFKILFIALGVSLTVFVLLVIKNYTGDVMNFEMAADMAADEGVEVAQVIVADDVAVEDSTWTTGRRGIAGTIFVHKIAGALAEAGGDLENVKRVAEKVIANVRSMGMALDACTVPAAGRPSFDLAEDEIEIGIGIHGEPGVNREKIGPVNAICDKLLDKILAEGIYAAGDRVALMVNGMGGTPLMELFIAGKHVHEVLADKGITIAKTLTGNYMTSLDMEGFSLTLLKLDDELEELLNAPADTPAFVQA